MLTKHLGVVQYPMMKSEEFFLSTFKSNSILAPEMIPIVITVIRGENKKEPVLPVTQTRTAYQSGAYCDGDLSRSILALLFKTD